MIKFFRNLFSRPAPKVIRASFDSAGFDADNARHWEFASNQSADAAANPEARKTIRNRARYELLENNSLGKGIVRTLVSDTIGSGPRLQLATGDKRTNQLVEIEWARWAHAVRLAEKLEAMKQAKTVDGESFAVIQTNPGLVYPVQLDLTVIEADRVVAPLFNSSSPRYIDGILLDPYGNVEAVDVLREHPGADFYTGQSNRYDRIPARNVIHFFRRDRPEQHRGVSEFVTALPLFAMLRRFTLATVTAAETAANHSSILSMPDSTYDEDDEDFAPWSTVQLQRNAAIVVPGGGQLMQMQAQHPTSTYKDFKRELLNEVARAVSMPYNVAAADSSGYNYASGRLDHQVYDRTLKNEQAMIGRVILDRIFDEWLAEASLVGLIPGEFASAVIDSLRRDDGVRLSMSVPHHWNWDRRPHVDPAKEANAQRIRLSNGTTSRALEAWELGLDIEELDQQAADGFGLSVPEYRQALAVSLLQNGNPGASGDSGEPDDSEPEESSDDEQENPEEEEDATAEAGEE